MTSLVALIACANPLDDPAPPDRPGTNVVEEPAHIPERVEPPAPVESEPPAARSPIEARADERVTIAAGALLVGTRVGAPHRRPSVEADLVSVPVAAVDIDRLPFPNDPAQPVTLAATRREAERACEERGRRLCTELEWERACRGGGTDMFATGESLALRTCATPGACPSTTGALEMGIHHAEWTASDAEERLARLERTAVIRGAHASQPTHAHRCGARAVANPEGGGRALAFRCCGGETPEASYPDVGLRRIWRDLDKTDAEWSAIFASIESLADLAEGFGAYGQTAALRALGRGGASEADMQWELSPGPFAWSPSPGEEVWIVAGASGERAVLAAIYPLPDGTFAHAASFVFEDEAPPIAVLRTRPARGELLFSTCWGCMGESGVVRFEKDATIVIAQQ